MDKKNIFLLHLNVLINHMYLISTKPPSSHQMPYLLIRLFFLTHSVQLASTTIPQQNCHVGKRISKVSKSIRSAAIYILLTSLANDLEDGE
jgi:hypothetical protein